MSNELFRRVCLQVEEGWAARLGTERDPACFPESDPVARMEALGLRLHHFGSPLLDPHFIDRAAWVKRHCTFPIHASISAEHLRNDAARPLVACGIDRLVVALDGTNDDEYKAIRGHRANYDHAVRGIEALLKARDALSVPIQIDVQLVDVHDDPGLRTRFLERWGSVGGLSAIVKPVFSYPDISEVPRNERRWPGPCAFPFLSVVVAVDGRVVQCCSDYNAEVVLGDLRKQSLQQIWEGERYRDVRRRFLLSLVAVDSLCGRCGFYGRTSCE